jgi:hypothetical protein
MCQGKVRHGGAAAKVLASIVHHGLTTSAALSEHRKLTDTESGSALLAMGILQRGHLGNVQQEGTIPPSPPVQPSRGSVCRRHHTNG